jgi:hypothetical protein
LGISFLVPLLIFKAPWLARQQFATESVSASNLVKGLFAQATGEVSLEEQNLIDENALNIEAPVPDKERSIQQQDAATCSTLGYSAEELKEGLQEVKGSGLSEDVGRYIGFGWKTFTREKNGVF